MGNNLKITSVALIMSGFTNLDDRRFLFFPLFEDNHTLSLSLGGNLLFSIIHA